MKTNVESVGKSRVRLNIDVDSDRWEKALEKAYRKVVKSISVPGFRKGKVPRPILERQYGQEVLYEDAMDLLVPEAFAQAVEETEIDPVGEPDMQVKDIDPEEGVQLAIEVDVYPQVELGEYRGLAAEKTVPSVDDEEVEQVLENMRERQSELVTVDYRTDAQEGDFAVVDFVGYMDGEPFSGGAAEDYMLELGSGQFIPGFEEQVVGMNVGEDKEIEVTFPEDYEAEHLAGKDVVFKVSLKELKEKVLPELDDEFAKDISEHDTLDALKEEIHHELLSERQRRAQSELENQLVDQVAANSEVEVPESLIERQSEIMLNEFSRSLMYQGMNLEYYFEAAGTNSQALMEGFRPDAEHRVKREAVLFAIAEEEGIEPTDEEVDSKIDELVEGSSQPEEARETYESRRDDLKASLKLEKAVDVIVENAELTEKAAD